MRVADLREIGEQRLAILLVDLRAGRHLHDHVRAVRAVAVLAHAAAAAFRREVLLVAVVDERVQPVDRLDDHVAAASAVATIRPAKLDELLPPERDAPVSAVAGANIDLGFVEELHRRSDRAYAPPRQSSRLRRMARNSRFRVPAGTEMTTLSSTSSAAPGRSAALAGIGFMLV